VDLRELLAQPGVEEECAIRSAVGFMALHGGSQDRGTDLIARRAAERAGASLYAIVQPPRSRVHLTSHRHEPDHSPRFRAFLDHISIAISVHGFGRDLFALWLDPGRGPVVEPYGPATRGNQTGPLTGIIVGGRNAELLAFARQLLHDRFAGYHVADERVRLGFHAQNPVNLPPAHGVQVELPPGLRGIGPFGDLLVPDDGAVTDQVVDALVELAHHAATLLPPPAGDGSVTGPRTGCDQNENVF
jgi:phage replication-related protein YjqB (UPF0714/DUF867 family)